MCDPAASRPCPPPLFHLLSSISHPSCISCTESSESFSCILYTEVSESWTAALLARMVDRVRVNISDDSNTMLPILKSGDSQDEFKKLRPVSLIPRLSGPPLLKQVWF